jgi:hypothetical protein
LTHYLANETGNSATSLDVKKATVATPVYKEIKVKERYLDSQCDYVRHCGFDLLESDCGFYISSKKKINIFNSSNIKSTSWRYDPDLGSPNVQCNPSGPGRGVGGVPSSSFPNCDPLGNLLIVQNPAVTTRPNDDARGGCIIFDLSPRLPAHNQEIRANYIDDFGLLDIEEGAKITVRNSSSRRRREKALHYITLLF